ncbi:hypothetical protein JCM3774_003357 [Rhodotorula dairenensis]
MSDLGTRRRSGAGNDTLSFIFLGTGCSSAVPDLRCYVRPDKRCPACADAFADPLHSKNVRGNTSVLVKVPDHETGGTKNILIDCGKTFRESGLKYFGRNGITQIDALLFTHPHVDAYGGLDDLRYLFQGSDRIQSHLEIYCTEYTCSSIRKNMPWVFPREPEKMQNVFGFRWKIMPDHEDWNICGTIFSAFQFHHGREPGESVTLCTAFLIDQSVLYASDVNYIPEQEWKRLGKKISLPTRDGLYSPESQLPRLQGAILDVTSEFWKAGPHFNLGQAILTARRLGAMRTLLTGFLHGYTHETWLSWG